MYKNAWSGDSYLGSDGKYVDSSCIYVFGRWVVYGNSWRYYAANEFLNEWLIFPVFMGNFNFFIGERKNFICVSDKK